MDKAQEKKREEGGKEGGRREGGERDNEINIPVYRDKRKLISLYAIC